MDIQEIERIVLAKMLALESTGSETCPSEGAPSTPPGFQLLGSGPPAGITLHPTPASALASRGRLLPAQAVVPMCACRVLLTL